MVNKFGRNFTDDRRQCWQTPPQFFDSLNAIFSFTVDACANDDNHLLPRYWTPETDALTQDWSDEVVFCNPPFKNPGDFMAKAHEAKLAVFIVHTNSLTTKYYRANPADVHVYPGYRVKFISPIGPEVTRGQAPLGSVVLVYGQVTPEQTSALWEVGSVFGKLLL
jgi:phage N-6-adenine-methyltransferase